MKKILIITEDKCDDAEIMYPYYRMQEEGYEVKVAALTRKNIHAKFHVTMDADLDFSECHADDFDGLILPGGTAPEKIRLSKDAVRVAREMFAANKPVCAICHGPQLLISAGVLKGRKATCYPGVADDLINAGAVYEDSRVVVDGNLVTSRRPEDLPYFMKEFVALLKK